MPNCIKRRATQWSVGMTAHSGVDHASGLVHHVDCTAAHVADVTQVDRLLHGEEDTVGGDSGPSGADKRQEFEKIATGFDRGGAAWWQTVIARLRAIVAHPFRVIKRQFGDSKVCDRCLAKTSAQVVTLFALSKLWMVRRHLLLQTGPLHLEGGKRPLRHHLPWETHLDRGIFHIFCEQLS